MVLGIDRNIETKRNIYYAIRSVFIAGGSQRSLDPRPVVERRLHNLRVLVSRHPQLCRRRRRLVLARRRPNARRRRPLQQRRPGGRLPRRLRRPRRRSPVGRSSADRRRRTDGLRRRVPAHQNGGVQRVARISSASEDRRDPRHRQPGRSGDARRDADGSGSVPRRRI